MEIVCDVQIQHEASTNISAQCGVAKLQLNEVELILQNNPSANLIAINNRTKRMIPSTYGCHSVMATRRSSIMRQCFWRVSTSHSTILSSLKTFPCSLEDNFSLQRDPMSRPSAGSHS